MEVKVGGNIEGTSQDRNQEVKAWSPMENYSRQNAGVVVKWLENNKVKFLGRHHRALTSTQLKYVGREKKCE